MALLKNLSTNFGLECPEAYIRITRITTDFNSKRAWVETSTYIDKASRNSGKSPLSVQQYEVYNNDEKPAQSVNYRITIGPVEHESFAKFTLDFDGDGVNEIELVEGVDFAADGKPETAAASIAAFLTSSDAFKHDWTLDISGGELTIIPIPGEKYDKAAGNSVRIGGLAVINHEITQVGAEKIPGGFDQYFSAGSCSAKGKNSVASAYDYMKQLPDFAGATDSK